MKRDVLIRPEHPTVIAEGRLAKIELELEAAKMSFLNKKDPNSPVSVTFHGDHGFYITIFDHRKVSIEAFGTGGQKAYTEVFSRVPCLGACRIKLGQYFVLADIGTEDITDGGEEQALVLTTLPKLDRTMYRVIRSDYRDAVHIPTKICLAEPRPVKTVVD